MKLPAGGKWEASGREYILPCPKCSKKFSWSVVKLAGQCFSCKFAITGIPDFNTNFRDILENGVEIAWQPAPVSRYPTPDTDDNTFLPAYGRYEAAVYLQGRGVTQSVAESVGIMATKDRIYVPCTSPMAGKRPMMMSRSIIPGQKGWMAPSGVDKSKYWFDGGKPVELTADGQKPLVIVEGIFDVLTPGLLGRAVALLGSRLSTDMESHLGKLFRNGQGRILLWLDPDWAGKVAGKKIRAQLRTYGCNVEYVGYHTSNEWRPQDGLTQIFVHAPEPGSCTGDHAREILRGHSCFV